MGYSVKFCHKHDPQSKGNVESTVHIIKSSFLVGRTFNGIDVLNSEAIEWLDRFINGDYHRITRKIPSEVFRDEEFKDFTKREK